MCEHARRTIRIHTSGSDGRPTHVAWQCDDCFALVKVGAGIWLPFRLWPREMEGWRDAQTGQAGESFSFDPKDCANWSATTQLLYVSLAARHGDWRALLNRGFEPTDTMKRLFVRMRAKYLDWRKRKDMEEELEDALPKFWFEIEPGHWVMAKSEEAARKFAADFAASSPEHRERSVREYPTIDTSKTCPSCKMRRVEPGKPVCGNCFSLGYER